MVAWEASGRLKVKGPKGPLAFPTNQIPCSIPRGLEAVKYKFWRLGRLSGLVKYEVLEAWEGSGRFKVKGAKRVDRSL